MYHTLMPSYLLTNLLTSFFRNQQSLSQEIPRLMEPEGSRPCS